ncbi:glutamate racemase [Nitratifractor salsuginis]|uniref:Glutamate racemase n=1 Tax=Nitratifractor salsuginis (strain DSM 16511 / JCM 12458 / E9I37-1) TaxID=749222 RepID=E6X0W1_NITSE|nr:glutamate racemase [Nitratifractor salsuginis]ADV46893.1 glutamate racemase [Nitratifractor salsuginis DSM 16511]
MKSKIQNPKSKIVRIGIFDSGLGGLTVLRPIMQALPGAEILYLADTAHAPYGEKSREEIRSYSLGIAEYFIREHDVDALVVACNTATSAAIATLRERFPDLPIVGTEPGIKPAVRASRSAKVGILATPATLAGEKYQALAERLCTEHEVQLFEQACPGLVERIERGEVESPECRRMLEGWLAPMREAGVDTIVLGCTHYPLAASAIREVMGTPVTLIETGEAIARRLLSLLGECESKSNGEPVLKLYATGPIDTEAVEHILGRSYPVNRLDPERLEER